jgi:hypothetical protein
MDPQMETLKTELRALVSAGDFIDSGDSLETLSKDFYWYSPVLKRKLDDKRADIVVRPANMAELRSVVAACCRARVPVVPRGAGTGNYGQCVPLYGGVVIDMSRLDRILSLEGGVAHVEAGARLGTVEAEARKVGWELRCMPSTWVKCTMAGFLCGGSGGVGSITWGGINAPGNVKAITMMTCEEDPRLIRLEEAESLKALHTYGTTGIMVEIEMRLAPKVDYDQLILSSPDWDRLLDWTDAAARRMEWHKRLVTQFEWPMPSYFKPLAKSIRPGESISFLLIDRSQADEAVASAAAAGIDCTYRRPLAAVPDRLHLEPHDALGDKGRPHDHLPPVGLRPELPRAVRGAPQALPGRDPVPSRMDRRQREDDARQRRRPEPRRDRVRGHPPHLLQVRGAPERDPALLRRDRRLHRQPPHLLPRGGRAPPEHRRQARVQGGGRSLLPAQSRQDEDLSRQPVRARARGPMSQGAQAPIRRRSPHP